MLCNSHLILDPVSFQHLKKGVKQKSLQSFDLQAF